MKNQVCRFIDSPVGRLRLVANDHALVGVQFPPHDEHAVPVVAAHSILDRAARELSEYFAGKRQRFTVPLEAAGTEFQRRVWAALSRIPFGETRSYEEIALEVGSARAVRAVGSANGKNPHAIIVPCHRVIQKSGALGGYGGGLAEKVRLLELEGQRGFSASRSRTRSSARGSASSARR